MRADQKRVHAKETGSRRDTTDSGLLTTPRRYVEVIDCVSRERGGSPLAMTRTSRYYANQTGSPL